MLQGSFRNCYISSVNCSRSLLAISLGFPLGIAPFFGETSKIRPGFFFRSCRTGVFRNLFTSCFWVSSRRCRGCSRGSSRSCYCWKFFLSSSKGLFLGWDSSWNCLRKLLKSCSGGLLLELFPEFPWKYFKDLSQNFIKDSSGNRYRDSYRRCPLVQLL